ncbi:MAG: PHP domain-containing protein [Myxococcota bacterium]
MIDLHSHTTASDGELPPEEQVALAASKGVTVLSVTDHDTVGAIEACQRAAQRLGVRLVPGIEVSTYLNRREVHILGHFVDPSEARLSNFEKRLKAERERRMELMVDKVKGLGFPVTMQMVRDLAGDVSLTRPHLARVLTELGFTSSPKEAFTRFLGDGKPAYVPRLELAPKEAIDLIRGAGGTATVAHPGMTKIDRRELEELKRDGLVGVEVGHSDHPPSQQEKLAQWADELELVKTAGSDYHGPTVSPGRSFGTVGMAPEELARLEARRP